MIKSEINKMLTRVLLESLPDLEDITPIDIALAMQNVTNVVCEVWVEKEPASMAQADGVSDPCQFCAKPCGNSWCPNE